MRLAWLIFGLILINVLRNALSAIRSCLLPRLGEQITFDMRRQVYRYLHRLSLNFTTIAIRVVLWPASPMIFDAVYRSRLLRQADHLVSTAILSASA